MEGISSLDRRIFPMKTGFTVVDTVYLPTSFHEQLIVLADVEITCCGTQGFFTVITKAHYSQPVKSVSHVHNRTTLRLYECKSERNIIYR